MLKLIFLATLFLSAVVVGIDGKSRSKRDGINPNSAMGPQDTDPRCNSEQLRAVMKSASGDDATTLKRSIQTLAEKKFRARYNVICADDDFSYITNTEEYCQETLDSGRTCYAFRQLSRLSNSAAKATSRQQKRLRKLFAHKQ